MSSFALPCNRCFYATSNPVLADDPRAILSSSYRLLALFRIPVGGADFSEVTSFWKIQLSLPASSQRRVTLGQCRPSEEIGPGLHGARVFLKRIARSWARLEARNLLANATAAASPALRELGLAGRSQPGPTATRAFLQLPRDDARKENAHPLVVGDTLSAADF